MDRPMLRRALWLLSVPLCIPALASASEDEEVRILLRPGRWHHVRSGTPLRITVQGVDHLDNVAPGSVRFFLNGHDVTAAFVHEAMRQGRVHYDAAARSVWMEVAAKLPPGEYVLRASYRHPWGGGRSFRQTFFVYDPAELIGDLGPVPQSAPRRGKRLDLFAPYATIAPADQEFVRDPRPTFRVRFGDTESGVDPRNVKILFDNADVTAQTALGLGLAVFRPSAAVKNGAHTLTAKVMDRAGNVAVENATVIVFKGPRFPWFFAPTKQPHPLAHTHHQYQRYSGAPYFHHGVDIRRPNGTRVYASRGGKVTNLNWYGRRPYYFEVEVTDDDGFRWQYHHVDQPQVPAAIYTAYRNGTKIATGTDIGAVVRWPVRAYGRLFHHIHLNLIAPDGRYMNPLNFMLEINDTTAPSVKRVFVLPNLGTSALNDGIGGATVSGKVDVVAEAEDLVQGQPYQLTVYRTTWEIEQLSGRGHHHMPETTFWRFNFLPGGGNRNAYVNDIFKPYLNSPAGYFRTCGNYSCRRFLYNVTNRTGSNTVSDASGYWDTAAKDKNGLRLWPNGRYRVTVRAYDVKGNSAARSIEVTVKN